MFTASAENLVAQTPRDIVYREGRGVVYRFRGSKAVRSGGSHVPVLLVPSLINRWYVLDLRPGASVAEALAAGPWETYCFDWGVPEDEDRYLTWDEVIARLERVVRFLCRHCRVPSVSLLGYCMGAPLAGIYTALHPERVKAFVNLLGPFDFSEAGRLATMVDRRWFDAKALTAAGNLGAPLMQAGFQGLAPMGSMAKWVSFFDKVHDPKARKAFAALETWASDNIPFPAAAYVTYIEELYQENRLVAGAHHVRGQRVDLGAIRCPVLTVVADRDSICPAPAAAALNSRVSSQDRALVEIAGGHVGAVVGSRASHSLYPQLVAWFENHGARVDAAPQQTGVVAS